ncbi:hypothetical protein PHMEG_00013931 [Phytophthora megakarya]|uniref:Uncharacterized protein n=1 Tax=Phytophthora megakarya TaxID=4795 RepID=A0A225W645_9STRA|nr:hypothetical protein PHMEG_00013931 [Phytophthora megakarya]
MTATNKAFAYVFKTTSEDQKVSHFLSVQSQLFQHCHGSTQQLDNKRYNSGTCFFNPDPAKRLNGRVAEGLIAATIQHFPECLMKLGLSKTQVLAWVSELQTKSTKKELEASEEIDEKFSREIKIINH